MPDSKFLKKTSTISGKRAIEQLRAIGWQIVEQDKPQTPNKTAKHNFKLALNMFPNAKLSNTGESITLYKPGYGELQVQWKAMLSHGMRDKIEKTAGIELLA